jgi:hypothetical protein
MSTCALWPFWVSRNAVGMTAQAGPHQPTNSRRTLARRVFLPAAAVLVLACPVATWWLVGDQSTVSASASPDFAIRPFDISQGAARAAGVGSAALATVTLLMLAWLTRRQLFDARWWSVVVPLLAAGFIAGAGWRVLTAGVIGANIGGGFVLIFGSPVLAALLLWALARSIDLLHRLHRPATPPANHVPT